VINRRDTRLDHHRCLRSHKRSRRAGLLWWTIRWCHQRADL